MASAAHSVIVDRPIAEVFAFLADGFNEPKWRADVSGVALASQNATGVGATWSQTMNGPGGRSIRGDYRFTRWEEPTLLEFEVIAGPAKPTGSFLLVSTGPRSTEVTFTLEFVPSGLMLLMRGMIEKQLDIEAASISALPSAMNQS